MTKSEEMAREYLTEVNVPFNINDETDYGDMQLLAQYFQKMRQETLSECAELAGKTLIGTKHVQVNVGGADIAEAIRNLGKEE